MEVVITKAGAEVVLTSGARQMFPIGWTGVVEDQVGAVWVEAGVASDITPEVDGEGFTPRQVAVLKGLADQIATAHDGAHGTTFEVDLDDMTVPELKDIAAQLEIDGASGMKKSELIEALSERIDDVTDLLRPERTINFADIPLDELRELASLIEIEGAGEMTESDLVARLSERTDEVLAALDEAAG